MIEFLDATVKLAVPLLFAALGELIAERAGVLNIGIEGEMLCAAFFGFWAAHASGSTPLGILAGVAAGAALAAAFGWIAVVRRADQVVTGMAANLVAVGLTASLYRGLFGQTGSALTVTMLPAMALPGLSRAPVVGPVLFNQNALVYLCLLLVPATAWMLQRTATGLTLRAVGEEPRAVDAAGIDVTLTRFLAVVAGGALAGFGGAYLSLASANTFTEGMSSGRGFIALSIVLFGRWSPWGVLGASLLFGGANALQFVLQSQGYRIPYQFLLALPYVVTLIVLAGASRGRKAPAALARPYTR